MRNEKGSLSLSLSTAESGLNVLFTDFDWSLHQTGLPVSSDNSLATIDSRFHEKEEREHEHWEARACNGERERRSSINRDPRGGQLRSRRGRMPDNFATNRVAVLFPLRLHVTHTALAVYWRDTRGQAMFNNP